MDYKELKKLGIKKVVAECMEMLPTMPYARMANDAMKCGNEADDAARKANLLAWAGDTSFFDDSN